MRVCSSLIHFQFFYNSVLKKYNSVSSILKNNTCTGYLCQTKPLTMNTLVKITVTILISFFSSQLEAQNNYSVTIKVEKAQSNDGKMFIALYNTESGFLEKTYKSAKSEIANQSCSIVFKDIPEGTYAVSIFHDENNNGKMDTNFFGIPTEDYGCSNGATGFFGPPKWNDAKFELKENKSITITL